MPDEITEEQLAEWSALCDAASRGPWEGEWVEDGRHLYRVFAPELGQCIADMFGNAVQADANGEFAVAARTAMPALIAALREARAKVEAWERFFGCESPHDAYAQDTSTWFGREQERANRAENALEAERAKVTRLREALDTIICNHLDNQRTNLLISARVLKETE